MSPLKFTAHDFLFKISSRSGMIQCHAKVRLLPRVLLFLG